LPGSESYALNVNGDLYDMGRVEVMPSRVILNQPRRPPEQEGASASWSFHTKFMALFLRSTKATKYTLYQRPLWVSSRHITSDFPSGCYTKGSSPSVSFLATVSERPEGDGQAGLNRPQDMNAPQVFRKAIPIK
jgi:hypothetical protein